MCVTFEPAKLSNTIVYIGECVHPEHGLIHVLGYQNQVENTVDGPNCMILHFPTAHAMGPDNALDCSEATYVLEDLRDAAIPAVWALGSDDEPSGPSRSVQMFEVGTYTVVLSDSPAEIPTALKRIPEPRRPTLNPTIFGWYQKHFPGYSVALCCFEGRAAVKSEPMLWWYKPRDPTELHAPAIDAHDGSVPQVGTEVPVDHALLVSVSSFADDESAVREDDAMPLHIPDAYGIRYRESVPEHLRPFLPDAVIGADFQQPMPNGDFIIRRVELSASNFLDRIERRPPPA